MKYTPEDKAEAVRLVVEDQATMADLVTRFGASRITIKTWLDAAGIEPARPPRAGAAPPRAKRAKGQSLRNTPLALKLEENVRRRVEGRTDLLR